MKKCIKCISAGEPPPSSIKEWCALQKEYLSKPDQHAFGLIDIVFRLANVYSAFKKESYANNEKTMVEQLLALEADLDNWEACLPENWNFTIESSPDGSGGSVFNGQCHVYRDLW